MPVGQMNRFVGFTILVSRNTTWLQWDRPCFCYVMTMLVCRDDSSAERSLRAVSTAMLLNLDVCQLEFESFSARMKVVMVLTC